MLMLVLALLFPVSAPAPVQAEPSQAEACAITRQTLDRRINRMGRVGYRHREAIRRLEAIEAFERGGGVWAAEVEPLASGGIHPDYINLTADELSARLVVCLETYPAPALPEN